MLDNQIDRGNSGILRSPYIIYDRADIKVRVLILGDLVVEIGGVDVLKHLT